MTSDSPAYVPGFEEDIFISYTSSDNPDVDPWVSNFCAHLQGYLGRGRRVWFDLQKMAAGDFIDPKIQHKVEHSALFIPIVSPLFLESKYCDKEREWFRRAAAAGSGLAVGTDRSRLIPIFKEPAPLPPELAPLFIAYREFFDPRRRLSLGSNKLLSGYSEFADSCKALARDLNLLLADMKQSGFQRVQPAAKPRVFVASACTALRASRASIVNYLANTCEVTGQPERSGTSEQLRAALKDELCGCRLAIHITSKVFGAAPEGEEELSAEWIEWRVARESGIRQLVCVPDDRKDLKGKQALFLDEIDAAKNGQTEVYPGFKALMDGLPDEICKLGEKAPEQETGVFLICALDDLLAAPLQNARKALGDRGLTVMLPTFEGPPEILRKQQADCVLRHEKTIIYYGQANDSWVKQKRDEVRAVLAESNLHDYPSRAILLSEPWTPAKKGVYGPFVGSQIIDEPKSFRPVWVYDSVDRI